MINVHPRLLGNLTYLSKPTLLPSCLVASTSMILTFRLKKELSKDQSCEMIPIFTNLYAYQVGTVRLFGRPDYIPNKRPASTLLGSELALI